MPCNAYGWDNTEPANYIHEVIADRVDLNMSSAVFPGLFERYHGCETDHAGMAQYLAELSTQVMGWVASPPDVLSGFGKDGNVANGGALCFGGALSFPATTWRSAARDFSAGTIHLRVYRSAVQTRRSSARHRLPALL